MEKILVTVILLISVLQIAAVVVRDYNKVNFLEFDSFQEFAKTYLTYNHGNTFSLIFLGVPDTQKITTI